MTHPATTSVTEPLLKHCRALSDGSGVSSGVWGCPVEPRVFLITFNNSNDGYKYSRLAVNSDKILFNDAYRYPRLALNSDNIH